MVTTQQKGQLLRVLILTAVLIAVMVLATQVIGLGRTGFDSADVLQQYFFYVAPGIGFLIGILSLFFVEQLITEGDNKYGNSLCFNSPGELIPLNFKIITDWKRLTLLSIIVFAILGIYASYTGQTSFTGVGELEQQFTLIDNILFSLALVTPSENSGAAFAAAFFLFLWRYFARSKKISKVSFIIVAVVIVILAFLLYGWFNHVLRYQESDVALQTVMKFWAVGGIITAITGSFIPFWIMHIMNNLFYELGKAFANDLIIGWTFGILLVLVVIYLLLFFPRRKEIRIK